MNEITVYSEFTQQLATFKEADAELVFDVETPEGEADCRAYYKKLRKVYNGVDKLRLETSKKYRQKVTDINAEGNAILAEIDAIANPRRALLDAKEARIQKEIDDLAEANRLKAEKEEADRIAIIEAKERELQERAAKLQAAEDAAKAEQERIEREKQAEADKLVAVEEAKRQAAQDAKDAAEKAEREKQDALAKAEQDKLNAVEAEKERVKQAEIAKKAEEDRLAEIERKRQNDEKHREKVEIAIIEALSLIVNHEEVAGEVMDAIRSGKIPHVEIKY